MTVLKFRPIGTYNVCTLPKWASNFTQMYKCMSTKKQNANYWR